VVELLHALDQSLLKVLEVHLTTVESDSLEYRGHHGLRQVDIEVFREFDELTHVHVP
jgi:hypothetical protein